MCEGQRRRARAAAPAEAALIKEQQQQQQKEEDVQSKVYVKKIGPRETETKYIGVNGNGTAMIARRNAKAAVTERRKTSSSVGMREESEEGGDGLEFGGPIGVTLIIIWSHYILLYFWYCLETNDGKMVLPTSAKEVNRHLVRLAELIGKSMPTSATIVAYVSFFTAQLVLAAVVPGITVEGTPERRKKRKNK